MVLRFLLVLAIATEASPLISASFSGNWAGTIEGANGDGRMFLTVHQQGGIVEGAVAYETESRYTEIDHPSTAGGVLQFTIQAPAGRVVTFRLALNNDELSGEAISGDRIAKVRLKKSATSGVYRVGAGVSAPTLVSKVQPEYTEEARRARFEGTVVLYTEIDPSGRARNIRVLRGLGKGLDENAIEAVKKWRFKPGYKAAGPVTVQATIEVNFRL